MDDDKPLRVLLVCLGNICRSPMAEGVLKHQLQKNNIKNIEVDSAGTAAYHSGEAPDFRAQNELKKHGINISNLSARKFREEDFDKFDLIYAMDSSNYETLMDLASHNEDKNKIRMFMSLVDDKINKSVPDPYYGGDDGFNYVYKMIDSASRKFVEKYK